MTSVSLKRMSKAFTKNVLDRAFSMLDMPDIEQASHSLHTMNEKIAHQAAHYLRYKTLDHSSLPSKAEVRQCEHDTRYINRILLQEMTEARTSYPESASMSDKYEESGPTEIDAEVNAILSWCKSSQENCYLVMDEMADKITSFLEKHAELSFSDGKITELTNAIEDGSETGAPKRGDGLMLFELAKQLFYAVVCILLAHVIGVDVLNDYANIGLRLGLVVVLHMINVAGKHVGPMTKALLHSAKIPLVMGKHALASCIRSNFPSMSSDELYNYRSNVEQCLIDDTWLIPEMRGMYDTLYLGRAGENAMNYIEGFLRAVYGKATVTATDMLDYMVNKSKEITLYDLYQTTRETVEDPNVLNFSPNQWLSVGGTVVVVLLGATAYSFIRSGSPAKPIKYIIHKLSNNRFKKAAETWDTENPSLSIMHAVAGVFMMAQPIGMQLCLSTDLTSLSLTQRSILFGCGVFSILNSLYTDWSETYEKNVIIRNYPWQKNLRLWVSQIPKNPLQVMGVILYGTGVFTMYSNTIASRGPDPVLYIHLKNTEITPQQKDGIMTYLNTITDTPKEFWNSRYKMPLHMNVRTASGVYNETAFKALDDKSRALYRENERILDENRNGTTIAEHAMSLRDANKLEINKLEYAINSSSILKDATFSISQFPIDHIVTVAGSASTPMAALAALIPYGASSARMLWNTRWLTSKIKELALDPSRFTAGVGNPDQRKFLKLDNGDGNFDNWSTFLDLHPDVSKMVISETDYSMDVHPKSHAPRFGTFRAMNEKVGHAVRTKIVFRNIPRIAYSNEEEVTMYEKISRSAVEVSDPNSTSMKDNSVKEKEKYNSKELARAAKILNEIKVRERVPQEKKWLKYISKVDEFDKNAYIVPSHPLYDICIDITHLTDFHPFSVGAFRCGVDVEFSLIDYSLQSKNAHLFRDLLNTENQIAKQQNTSEERVLNYFSLPSTQDDPERMQDLVIGRQKLYAPNDSDLIIQALMDLNPFFDVRGRPISHLLGLKCDTGDGGILDRLEPALKEEMKIKRSSEPLRYTRENARDYSPF